jgi:aldehyde dehydrogenase (NAD+)
MQESQTKGLRMMDIKKTIQRQRAFFNAGETRDIGFRIEQLKKLKAELVRREADIEKALHDDFSKCAFETYATEIGLILSGIDEFERHLKAWARPRTVPKSMATFHAKSTIVHEPFGVTLIMSPWNYPLQLTLAPLIGAMAAGNTAVVKPSRYTPQTAALLKRIIEDNFSDEYIALFEGGRDVNEALLAERYDFIFFTGGTTVGKVVMSAAAQNLTPVVLELGGKSPVIVDETANIAKTAKSLCWGKFLNGGQTCIAPDFVMAKCSVIPDLLNALKETITSMYGEDPRKSPDFARIITPSHFERVSGLIDPNKVFCGGQTDAPSRYIAPTVMKDVTFDDAVMGEEIFGPVLPVIAYDDEDDMLIKLQTMETPLAFYIFSTDKKRIQKYLMMRSSGDAVVNDTIIHSANPHLPFGGKGYSGMGAYHGRHSFETFSHKRSVVYRHLALDLPRYAPYPEKFGFIKRFL